MNEEVLCITIDYSMLVLQLVADCGTSYLLNFTGILASYSIEQWTVQDSSYSNSHTCHRSILLSCFTSNHLRYTHLF